jgi:hypothetical protein
LTPHIFYFFVAVILYVDLARFLHYMGSVNLQWHDTDPKNRTLCESMKDYSVLKSSREALLRKAGFQEGHVIFNSGSLRQMPEFPVEGDGKDVAPPVIRIDR